MHDEDPIQRMQAVPNRPQKVVCSAASNSDTLIDSAATVYPIYIGMKRNGYSTQPCESSKIKGV